MRAKTTSTTRPAPSRESPASTRPPRLRAPCLRSAHHANLRLLRVGFRPAARCRQCARICRRKEARRRKRLLRPTPRFHGNLPRPLDHHGRAHRVLARRITRIFVSRASAFARLCAAASARAKAAFSAASPFSGTRVSSYSRSNVWNTRTGTNSPTMSVESVCASKRLSASESVSGRKRAGESGSYDPPRAFTVISRVHSTATVARTVPSLGASYCTRIFVSRASAFARLRAAANAPESAVGRKRATPACGQKRLLRPSR